MNALTTSPTVTSLASQPVVRAAVPNEKTAESAFQEFVGETFFGMMLKALRSTSEPVAYMDGGQAEEMFRNQLDQTIAADLAKSHGEVLSKPLFDQFQNRLDVSV